MSNSSAGISRVLLAALVDATLDLPVLRRLARFYRHLGFNVPRFTTAVGVGALLGIAAVRLFLLAAHSQPGYLAAYFGLIGAAACVACAAMLVGRRPALVRIGWALGSLVALASLLMYVVSRTLGLPDLPQAVGRWAYPPGTFAMALSALFLAIHGSVLTGMNVAYPDRQPWHD
ncbi:MAG TPA: oxidoreductase [Mycobacteriales bacterium]